MSKMKRKNKKHKSSKSNRKQQNIQKADSNSSDSGSILTINNVESYFLDRNIEIPQLDNIIMHMKQEKKPDEGQNNEQSIIPLDQPSTSVTPDIEALGDKISGEKNEAMSGISRNARRRRRRKERLALEKNSETSKVDGNPIQKETDMSDNTKTDKKKLSRNARRRQKIAEAKKPKLDPFQQIHVLNNTENVPNQQTKNGKRKNPQSGTENLPASMIIRKIAEKERDLHFRKPDYENCDYYAYDYETVEECAEELGPNETIEVTIDCREYIPMFAEFVPIRHYFENTRVVRLIQKSLLDTSNPPLLLPIELVPIVVTDDQNNNGNGTAKKKPETSKKEENEDEVWFSWMDPVSPIEIKKEVIEEKVEKVPVAKEIINVTPKTSEKNPIKTEKKEDKKGEEETFQSELIAAKPFKNMAYKVYQIEKDLKKLNDDMVSFQKTLNELKKLSIYSRIRNLEAGTSGAQPRGRSVESQTDNTLVENKGKVNNVQNMIMKIGSDCSKNVTVPLCDEEINIEQFAACVEETKSRRRKIQKTPKKVIMSLPGKKPSKDTIHDSKTKMTTAKPDDKQLQREMRLRQKLAKATAQKTALEKLEIKLKVGDRSLVASDQTEAEVEACVKEILKQLKERAKSNAETVVTEQPLPQAEPIREIRKLKTIQEINQLVSKHKARTDKENFIETHYKYGTEDKIDYRDVIAQHKSDIEEKLNLHEFCTCKRFKQNPRSPHLCVKGHRLCFSKNKNVTNEQVAISAAEWSYLLKLGFRQDEAFYKELLASNTVEDSVIFLKYVEDEFIANGITVSSIPALRIESDRDYEVDDDDPDIKRAELIRQVKKRDD